MDEFKAREARNMRKNKLKRKRGGTLPGELGLGTNKTAYIDGGITTIVPSSSSVPVAIDTTQMDEFKAREARNMRKNKLKRKRGGTLPGELGLGTNKTAYIDGGITTIVPSSSSVPVAIDTSLVKELKPSTTLWAMRLRPIRSFVVPAYNNKNEVASFEFIFQDKEGDRVHASARGHAMNLFKVKPVEGHLYALKDFVVLENRSKFKTTVHPYKINFLRKTKMEEIFDEKFPETIYNLKSFNQLEEDKESSQFLLFDVIGRIVSCQLPPVATERGKKMEFILEDHVNNNIKCTLWDNYVDDLLPFVEADSEENIIVLIEFGRISIFGGLANSGSVSASLTTFESISAPNIYDAFKNTEADVKNIAEIIRSDEDGQFWVSATIIQVESLKDWCYLACNKCSKKLSHASNSFLCAKCGMKDHQGQYKVQVRETDQKRNSVIYNVTRLTADEKILSIYNENYLQKKEAKLLCYDEEIKDNGDKILNSSENSYEAVEKENEELPEKKMNMEGASDEGLGKRRKKCLKKEK
ncbi:hypothetical protein OROHE_006813 [Orobanche hederae]